MVQPQVITNIDCRMFYATIIVSVSVWTKQEGGYNLFFVNIMEFLKISFYLLHSSLALISKIYIIINKEPVERVRSMFMILVLLLTLASFLYVTIGIAKKIFSIFALITPIVVLCVGLLIAMN